MLSVVLFDELWTGDVLQFIFDLFKYIIGFVVLIAINMFFKKNMGDPLWEKIANPYKDDEEKKWVRINFLSSIHSGNKQNERLVRSQMSQ